MKQDRQNNCLLTHCHKSITDTLDTVKDCKEVYLCQRTTQKAFWKIWVWVCVCVWLSRRWASGSPPPYVWKRSAVSCGGPLQLILCLTKCFVFKGRTCFRLNVVWTNCLSFPELFWDQLWGDMFIVVSDRLYPPAQLVMYSSRGGSRGRVQGVHTPPPPEITCGFLIQLVFWKKKLVE